MRSTLVLAVTVSLVVSLAAPAWSGTLDIYEDSLGAPGVTAVFANGNGLIAEIVYDASSSEEGGLLFGASEITILPAGNAVLVAFACQIADCSEANYEFTPGGAGVGSLIIADTTDFIPNPMTGVFDLGDITWNSLLPGSLELTGCTYTTPSTAEYECDPFQLATAVPEPGTASLLSLALAALGIARRRRS